MDPQNKDTKDASEQPRTSVDMADGGDDRIEIIESLGIENDPVVSTCLSAEVKQSLGADQPSGPASSSPHVLQTRSAMADMSFHDFEAFMIRAEGGPDLRIIRPTTTAGASMVGFSADLEAPESRKSARDAGKPTRTRPISKIRDAIFLRFIRDLADTVSRAGDTADLYKKSRFSNNNKGRAPGALGSSKPFPDSTPGDEVVVAESSDSASGSGSSLAPGLKTTPALIIPASVHDLCAEPRQRYIRAAWRYRPWWHELELPQTAACSYRAPAGWDYTSDHLTVTLRHIAIKALAQQLGISFFSIKLRISPAIESQISTRGDQIGWLRERFTKHMKAELGEALPFQIVLTHSRQHSFVLLGEMALPHAQKTAARRALQKVGGWFAGLDKDALRMDLDPDNGWVNIMVRDLRSTGSPVSANRPVDREAKRIYEQEWLRLTGR